MYKYLYIYGKNDIIYLHKLKWEKQNWNLQDPPKPWGKFMNKRLIIIDYNL